jgi:hypothetical protein
MKKIKDLFLKSYVLHFLINFVESCSHLDFTRSPNDCSTFYRCSNNILYTFYCPSGLLFDESVKVCNYANMVNCNTQTTTMSMINPAETWSGIMIIF